MGQIHNTLSLRHGTLMLGPAEPAVCPHERWTVLNDTTLSRDSQAETIRSESFQVNDQRVHMLVGGDGPPVLLLHGYPETSHAWRKVMPELATTFRVVAPDLRGLGQSSRPATGYDKKTVAEDIWGLTRVLGLEDFALVSADMGGPVAFWLAMAHPEAVSHFVFIESGLPGFGLEQLMDIAHGGSWHFGFFMAPEYPEILTAGREREFLRKFAYRDPLS